MKLKCSDWNLVSGQASVVYMLFFLHPGMWTGHLVPSMGSKHGFNPPESSDRPRNNSACYDLSIPSEDNKSLKREIGLGLFLKEHQFLVWVWN